MVIDRRLLSTARPNISTRELIVAFHGVATIGGLNQDSNHGSNSFLVIWRCEPDSDKSS